MQVLWLLHLKRISSSSRNLGVSFRELSSIFPVFQSTTIDAITPLPNNHCFIDVAADNQSHFFHSLMLLSNFIQIQREEMNEKKIYQKSFQNYVIIDLKMYDISDKLFILNDICTPIEPIDSLLASIFSSSLSISHIRTFPTMFSVFLSLLYFEHQKFCGFDAFKRTMWRLMFPQQQWPK